MNRLNVQFLDHGFHRVLFDAVPAPVFVMDTDLRILDCNQAATRLIGKSRRFVKQRHSGEVLRCIHAAETKGGCGCAPACRDCVVRQCIRAASRGRRVVRQQAKMELLSKGGPAVVNLRVSCQPFTYGRSAFILLILEGLND
ncbi:MAG TPA: PAS domain-containing protein [Verrucomicrobiae bacterium]|nr:PAS domain-containing protein [Verrucomicrobiae bacterium]